MLQHIYKVPWTVEQVGTNLVILQVHILCVGSHIHRGLKNNTLLSYLCPQLPVNRYSNAHALNAQRTVRGMCANLPSLASELHTTDFLFLSICSHIVWEFML